MLLEWTSIKLGLGPEIRGKESIDLLQSSEDSLEEVLLSGSLSSRRGETVLNTSEVQKLLRGRCSNDSSTSGGWNESNSD